MIADPFSIPTRAALAAVTGLSAVGTGLFAAVTTTDSHRIWAVLATAGYLAASATAAWPARSTAAVLRVAGIGAALLPTLVLVVARIRQPEVDVIERSARVLLDTGSPYLAVPEQLADVNPYLPAMAVFGLPRQLLGDTVLADARLWFLAAFLAALVPAARARLPRAADPAPGSVAALLDRPSDLVWAVLACPFVALPAAVGGHDLPVVGLLCLGMALAARLGAVPAGLALGAAAALKQSAWPGVAVAVALLAVLAGPAAARRCALVAGAAVVAVLLPVLLGPAGRSALGQLAGFPLAASQFVSPATSPTPGVLLANGGPAARLVGLALLVGAVLAIAVALVRRPPRGLAQAAAFLALSETVAALVLPTSRFGYVVYPAVLLLWAIPLSAGRRKQRPVRPALPMAQP